MNEQQMADLFSQQLDRLFQGERVGAPDEAGELQELLWLSQQVSQIEFQPDPATQAAFAGQVAAWFEAGSGMPAAAGVSKVLLTGAVVALAGLGLGLVATFSGSPTVPPAHTIMPATVPATPKAPLLEPAGENHPEQPADQPDTNTPAPGVTTSLSDEIKLQPTSSLGDVLVIPSPSLVQTDLVTATTPATTPADNNSNAGPGDDSAGEVESSQDSTDGGLPDQTGNGPDDDRGHGNDPGGYDPDNPGNSSGVSGGSGSSGSASPSDFGQGQGSGASGGGQGSSSGGQGNAEDKGNKGGKGKGKQ